MAEDNGDRQLCILIKAAISKERALPPLLRDLREKLHDNGLLTVPIESRINRIINEEEEHEKFFLNLADKKNCILSTKEQERKLYSDLPLRERLRLAKQALELTESVTEEL